MGRYENVTLAIIAGGQGSRLSGVPKGLLVFEGRPILSRLVDLAPLFGQALLVSGAPSAYAAFGLERVEDVIPNRGAPGGLHAALVSAHTEWVFAVGCDMPFVSPAVVKTVLSMRADDVDIVAFEIDGRIEPLLGAYRARIATTWGRALASQPSFREMFQYFQVNLLSEVTLRGVDPQLHATVSINTPADLAKFGVQLPGSIPRVP